MPAWAFGNGPVVIRGGGGAAPAPVIATVTIWVDTPGASGTLAVLARVEVDRLMVIERLPEALPIADGAKVIVKVALCPPDNVKGSVGPLRVKPPPDAAICMSVMAPVPEFLRVIV